MDRNTFLSGPPNSKYERYCIYYLFTETHAKAIVELTSVAVDRTADSDIYHINIVHIINGSFGGLDSRYAISSQLRNMTEKEKQLYSDEIILYQLGKL